MLMLNVPMGNGYCVYDCQYPAIEKLIGYSSGLRQQEFYIVDKKYKWLLYVRLDRDQDMVSIYTNDPQAANLKMQ